MKIMKRYFVIDNNEGIEWGTEIINVYFGDDFVTGNLMINVFSWASLPSQEKTTLPRKCVVEKEFTTL